MADNTMPGAGRRGFHLPHTLTLIFLLMVVFCVLTWIIPSGQYDRELVDTGSGTREVTVAGTYHSIDKVQVDEATGEETDLKQGALALLMAPTQGIQSAADVVCFILIVGGAFGIITKTDAINAGMQHLIRKLKNKDILIIPISMTLFSLGGTTFGMSEESLPFFAIFVPIMLNMGFDSMTAFLICFVGPSIGYMASTINPFNVLIAQGVLGIQGNPQLWFRAITWVIMTALAIVWVMLYARRVKRDPRSSVCYEQDVQKRRDLSISPDSADSDAIPFTARQKGVLVVFIGGMLVIVWGLITQGWYMDEISGIFLVMGLLGGIIAGMDEAEMAQEFVNGVKDFSYAAIVVGFARAILVLAENGRVIDTILNALVTLLGGVPSVVYVIIMFAVLMVLAFVVPSSSGLAALTMPILGPLTELMGMNPEAAVTALTFASKVTTMVNPLSAITVAGLAICGLNLGQWFKLFARFAPICIIAGIVFSAISGLMPA